MDDKSKNKHGPSSSSLFKLLATSIESIIEVKLFEILNTVNLHQLFKVCGWLLFNSINFITDYQLSVHFWHGRA